MADERQPDRRGELVLSAIRAFAREGVPHATTRVIAQEAGVNVATLHYHFGGKDQLVAAVMEVVSRQHADIVRGAVPTDAGLEDGLVLGLTRMWPYLRETETLQLLSYELTTSALRHDDADVGRGMARAQYGAYIDATRDVIAEILDHSGQRIAVSLDDLSAYVVAGLDGIILMSLVDPVRAERQLELFVSSVIVLADAQPPMRTIETVRVPVVPRPRRRQPA